MLFRLGVMLMPWKSDKYRIKLNINLPNGIYVLGAESGLGKTYLASWLNVYVVTENQSLLFNAIQKLLSYL